ncbi:uncharacterized protein BJ171DRAFT_420039 [Polychytrium aggregatum]|uniref:uncharacterized protein n=1 Tax=Polychytrium aggregatum TaxID=110093 RepID=UPI0022FE9F7F|nr:uncharacterized protein BJ171DRAFT_420039 [Polychytrium aggregatum]KAI9208112.1 hypothetical protein BJ171DRAFT_420039 [Polychytrium aggregatum]
MEETSDLDASDNAYFSDDHDSTSENDDDDEENLDFAPVIPEKDIKKEYEVDFTVHTESDIFKFQKSEIDQVSSFLGGIPQHIVASLLRHFKWNKDLLMERYMEDPDGVARAAGVVIDDSLSAVASPKYVSINGFCCDICCNDEAGLATLALSCEHRFCRDCYEHYLTMKIDQEGESRRIQCMASGCKLVVDEPTIKLVVKPEVFAKYQKLLLRAFVDDLEYYKWCPAPNCVYAVEYHIGSSSLTEVIPTVHCNCGHSFCFGCSLPDHQPCICPLVREWLKKCADDSETSNWISANTKECPKCHATIEKNGGCNHMNCRKCKYEFCWVCQGPWSEHGSQWYNCNRYDERASVEARDAQGKSRAALEKYLHYYNRFANHEQSAKLDKDLHEKTEKKMEEMQNSSELSWIEVQFLREAVDVLIKSRMTLKWTYAFAYYLERGNATDLFEDNQRDLEMAVEQLSGLLEEPIAKEKIFELKQKVLDKKVYVAQRREVLLIDTSRGLREGRWNYTAKFK